jgi:N-acetylglucosaminylphosphatidylinositol deacetylase
MSNFYEMLESFQSNIKLFLTYIILSNFLIIFLLKFFIRLKDKYQSFFSISRADEAKKPIKDVLVVIAHPDDEVMFFYPSLKIFTKNSINIRLICFSNGDYDGLGKLREEEIKRVAKELKIEDLTIVKHDKIKDDPNIRWDANILSEKIKEYFMENNNYEKIGTILTFDELGVTKHANHISCNEGLVYIYVSFILEYF